MKRIIACFLLLFPLVCGAQDLRDSISVMEHFIGLSYTDAQRDSLSDGLMAIRERISLIHEFQLSNEVSPSLVYMPAAFHKRQAQQPVDWGLPADVSLPVRESDLAFYSVEQLAALIRDQKITSTKLTRFYLDRLKRYGDTLQCVISLLEERALEHAAQADAEIAAGNYRGPLHGIPYGLKDLFAVEGTVTSWGAMPYRDQEIAATATVVARLDDAGAILVAKLSLGALAMGDVWYGGTTKNPWNLSQGSSGSSAGSASAVSAGLVPFAIGTETLGSIVSPSTRCGVTGLRPTFGRVSRYGGMALSWSMDKVGPIARSAKDCALVFEVIRGADGRDPTVVEDAFNYGRDPRTLKVGYFADEFARNEYNPVNDSISLAQLRAAGIELHEVSFPRDVPVSPLRIILSSEAGAAFDLLTRSQRDTLLVRQDINAWPNFFRTSRFIPAADYINANRIRNVLFNRFNEVIKEYDVIIAPSFSLQLVLTNLTGHPCLVVPNGFNEGSPTSITFLGRWMGEAELIAFGELFQALTEHDEKHPEGFTE